jgi:uncharacterized protein YjlB
MTDAQDRHRLVHPVEPVAHRFADDGAIPNNPALPMLVYAQVLRLEAGDPAEICEAMFVAGGWPPAWRDGIYPFPHYHSTAHEALALALARGEVLVRLGGALGIETVLRAGDVLVLPAGTGHQNLGASADLLVIGAYPPGQRWDLLRGRPEERPKALASIAKVPLPVSDPVHGAGGPLTRLWRAVG